jgi:hypothetical protein
VHDATPRAMVSPVNHIITNFHSRVVKNYPDGFSHLFFMFRDKSGGIEMFPCKIMLLILVEVSDFTCFNGYTKRKMNINHLH